MPIKYFDYDEWVKADLNYAALLNSMYKTFSKKELESFLEKEMNTKLITKKQIEKCFTKRGQLSWAKIKTPSSQVYHARSIGLKGQYSAIKIVVEDVLRKKINKSLNDKMLTLLVLRETLQAHKSKKIRKIIYLSST